MPDVVYALVDYDNQRPVRFGHYASEGRRPNLRDHEDYLSDLVEGLLDVRRQLTTGFLELRIRLYGGWSTVVSGERTDVGDMVAQAIARFGRSSRVGSTRWFLELAESVLVLPEEILGGTFRSGRWRGEVLRFHTQPARCRESPTSCSVIAALSQWSRGRCPKRPTCPVHSEEVVSLDGQKLVDAMLISDTIAGSAYQKAHVLAVSMDDDMVPGVLSARALGGLVTLVRFGRRDPSDYDVVLKRNGVDVIDLPALGA